MNISLNTRITGLLVGFLCCMLPLSDTVAQAYGNISFETFYHELAPYGDWVNNSQYGQVWIPNVERGFRPYQTRGHWVMTEYGNTWVSDYAWGWAPFHYGRWHLDDYYGWVWVPGTEWGPAWVAWRSGGGYYGWAPLRPGLNVSINIGRRIPRPYWTFVRQRYITSPRIYNYCVPRRRIVNVINHTTIINNTYVSNDRHRYYSGPRTRDIERVTQRRVPVRRLQSSRRPGATSVRRGSVAIYRPTVRGRQGNSRSVAPSSSRSVRGASRQSLSRGDSPTRSSYDRTTPNRDKQPTSPAVRSSRTRESAVRSSGSQPSTTRSMYDNRSSRSSTATPQYRETSRSRTSTRSQGSSRQKSVERQRSSSSSSRYESRSTPSRSQTRTRSSSTRSSTNSRYTAPRQRSQTQTRSSRSSSPSYSRSSSPSRSSSNTRRSSPAVSRPSVTRSAPAQTRSRSTTSSSSSRSSSDRSSSGRSRSSRP